MDRAGRRSLLQREGMIGMGMGDHDPVGPDVVPAPLPAFTAVDHHPSTTVAHQQGGVMAVAPRLRLDVAARAEEGEFHARIALLCREYVPAGRQIIGARRPPSFPFRNGTAADAGIEEAQCDVRCPCGYL